MATPLLIHRHSTQNGRNGDSEVTACLRQLSPHGVQSREIYNVEDGKNTINECDSGHRACLFHRPEKDK